MPIESKVTTEEKHTITAEDGHKLTVSGETGSSNLWLEIYEPATGMGMSETPSSRASLKVSFEDWDELVKRVERLRQARVRELGPR